MLLWEKKEKKNRRINFIVQVQWLQLKRAKNMLLFKELKKKRKIYGKEKNVFNMHPPLNHKEIQRGKKPLTSFSSSLTQIDLTKNNVHSGSSKYECIYVFRL